MTIIERTESVESESHERDHKNQLHAQSGVVEIYVKPDQSLKQEYYETYKISEQTIKMLSDSQKAQENELSNLNYMISKWRDKNEILQNEV